MFHQLRAKHTMIASFQNKATSSWQLQQLQTEKCLFPEMGITSIHSLADLRMELQKPEMQNLPKTQRPMYFKPSHRFFTGIDSFAIIPTLPDCFKNKILLLQIFAGSSGDKKVKKLPELRKIFEDSGFLGKEEDLNFALVVPLKNLKQPVNVKFQGEKFVTSDGKTSYKNVEHVRQWKIATLPAYKIPDVAAVSIRGGYVSPRDCGCVVLVRAPHHHSSLHSTPTLVSPRLHEHRNPNPRYSLPSPPP